MDLAAVATAETSAVVVVTAAVTATGPGVREMDDPGAGVLTWGGVAAAAAVDAEELAGVVKELFPPGRR